MSDHNEERRPRQEAALKTPAKESEASLPNQAETRRLARRAVIDLAHKRAYAVRVISQRRDGVLVTQIFSDLKAAEAKADRTRARGLDVRLELVRLTPVMPLETEDVTR